MAGSDQRSTPESVTSRLSVSADPGGSYEATNASKGLGSSPQSSSLPQVNTDASQEAPTSTGSKRVGKACQRCRKHKIKCDDSRPCLSCVRNHVRCEPFDASSPGGLEESGGSQAGYLGPRQPIFRIQNYLKQTKRRETDVPARTTAPQDDRITELEAQIAQLRHERSYWLSTLSDYSTVTRNTPSSTTRTSDPAAVYPAPSCGLSDYLFLSVSSKGRIGRRYNYAFAYRLGKELHSHLTPEHQALVALPRFQSYGWNMSGSHYLTSRKINATPHLLSRGEGEWLLDYYFRNINPLFAILHEDVFRVQFADYFNRPDDHSDIRMFTALLHLVYALAVRVADFSDGTSHPPGLEEKLFDDAYHTLEAFSFEWETVELVQGWLLVAQYLRMAHRQTSAWLALGRAVHLAKGLALLSDVSHLIPLRYDVFRRTRVFWSCYAFDRFFALDSGRPLGFTEAEIGLERPRNYQPDGWLTPLAHLLIKLAFVVSQLGLEAPLTNHGSPVPVAADAFLRDWVTEAEELGLFSNRPDSLLRLETLPQGLVVFCRLAYYSVLLSVHVRSLYYLVLQEIPSPIGLSNYRCLESAEGTAQELSGLLEAGISALSMPMWLNLSSAYNAGTVFVAFVNAGIYRKRAETGLGSIIRYLEAVNSLGKFGMVQECLWALKTLSHMVYLRMQESAEALKSTGIDPGPDAVNDTHFTQLGKIGEPFAAVLNSVPISVSIGDEEYARRQCKRQRKTAKSGIDESRNSGSDIMPDVQRDDTYENMAMNMAWFDNWTTNLSAGMDNDVMFGN